MVNSNYISDIWSIFEAVDASFEAVDAVVDAVDAAGARPKDLKVLGVPQGPRDSCGRLINQPHKSPPRLTGIQTERSLHSLCKFCNVI